ncbi:hypothetical protein QM787_25820 [Rhodococcus ruber]|uniref:Uncharacterized protein n=2 Tax=Rhodococcus TaxID=1827 RepID=A0ABQ0YIB2_9NOCA|nr:MULTISPECIES: hypothetical protein [Rhodococcus]MCZ4505455.1 hypothetical protein [Rhodococcus ruber]MCZ4533664.1 hypothetical protein [Rhodococcus ruber]MCZ4622975.1 hypothetical protein [Rhodococcus ruber]MDI9984298.1 hypothetical protein [Rhodococcus ruber]MDJ0000778.1 hypothetical protein [Rhodococcus ruber]
MHSAFLQFGHEGGKWVTVIAALDEIAKIMPFPILGVDSPGQ